MNSVSAQALTAFLEANPGIDWTRVNLLDPSARDALQWGELDPETAAPSLRAHQRLASVGADPVTAQSLIASGLHSANHIARIPRRRFVEETAPPLGLDGDSAEMIHRRATTVQNKTYQLWANAAAAVSSPVFRNSRFTTVGDDVAGLFEDLPSYQELFGTLDYCICPECRSIFGPAAYLTDLQRIILEYVTTPNSATIPADLTFSSRRPDIGNIPLTCTETNTLVSYLQIVNQVLVAYMQQELELSTPDAVLQALATTLVYPFDLPFNTPLNQMEVLLEKSGAPYGTILTAWGSAPASAAPRSLGISPDTQAILVAPANTADTVAPYFNVAPADLGTLADPDVFEATASIDFAGLLSLLQEDLSPAEVAAGLQENFFINAQLGGQVVALVPVTGTGTWTIANLTVPALDAINRQFRLTEALGWSNSEVDWALRAAQNGGTPVLAGTPNALVALAAMVDAAKTLSFTNLQAASLFGPIKTYGQGELGTQFDRLFNTAALVAQAGAYRPSGNPLNPTYTSTPLAWTPGSTATADVAAITRVLPGLGLSLTDANTLGLALYGATAQTLTVTTLSALYRHAIVAAALKLPMPRYVKLLALLGQASPNPFTAATLPVLLATAAWISATGLNVFQLDYVINDTPSVYVALPYRAASVPAWQESLIRQFGDGGDDPDATVTDQIAVLFGVPSSQIAPILSMATKAVPLPDTLLTWAETFLAATPTGTPLYPQYAAAVLEWCSRWLVLQAALSLPDPNMASVALYPGAYGLPAGFTAIPLTAIQNISAVQTIMATYGDAQNKLLVYIAQKSDANPPPGDPLATLSEATGWPPAQSQQLLDGPVKIVTPLAAQLTAMNVIFGLMAAVGADPALFGQIASLADATASSSWTTYNSVSQAVLAAVQSRYGTSWTVVGPAIAGELEVAERDALLSWVQANLRSKYSDITTARNVYEYLLIDVEMGPETQISTVKEALNACQLYLQRCRLGLEPGVVTLDIAPAWWEWMMNYRVWEANRQIFVYPENYLVPTLLTDGTPLYYDLQTDLQQSDVTKDYVEVAFDKYMEGFIAAAQYTPVETLRTKINDARMGTVDCTFVFAKSSTDPVTFHWARKIDGFPWTAWRKIDVPINATTISPVYAFGRLFVFWLEVTTVAGSSIETAGGGSVSTSSVTVKTSLSYSFLNKQNKWVQEQSLRSEEIVYYASSGTSKVALASNPVFTGLFDFTQMAWRRPAVLHVTPANLPIPPQTQTEEKICVLYGPILPDTVNPIDPGPPPSTSDPAALAFYAQLRQAVLNHNQVVNNQTTGYQLLRPGVVIDALLHDSVVFHEQEFYLFDQYWGPTPLNQVDAQLSTTSSSLLLVSCPTPISANLIEDPNVAVIGQAATPNVTSSTFITSSISSAMATNVFNALKTAGILVTGGTGTTVSTAALATTSLVSALQPLIALNSFGAPQIMDVQKALFASVAGAPLFTNVSPISSAVATVKNQPGSFVLYAGDEVFLLKPKQSVSAGLKPVFSEIDESAVIGPPPITPITFVSTYSDGTGAHPITQQTSQRIYTNLASYGIISNGVYNASLGTFSVVGMALQPLILDNSITTPQIQMVFNLLNDSPAVTTDVFVNPAEGINATLSAAIYTNLAAYGIIDVNSRTSSNLLTPTNVKLAMEPLVTAGSLTPYQMPHLYAVLNRAPIPVGLKYTNTGDASAFASPSAFTFEVTRLTTSAVGKLDQALFAGSIDALLSTSMQGYPVTPVLPFSRFAPSTQIIPPNALDGTQVDFDGLYGEYFWEIFFHVPRLVAYMLANNGKYPDAVTWLQYIFNPTVRPQPVTASVIVTETNGAINTATAPGVITALQSNSIGSPAAPILSQAGMVNPALRPSTDLSFLMTAPPNLSNTQMLMVQAILLNYELATPSCRYWQFFPFRNYTQESLTAMLSDDNPAMLVYNDDPFDPYAIARLRIGAFEKTTVMQYIDTLIQWGDALFTVDTWETITAAGLLYVYASDLLGPRPVAVGACPGSDVVLTFNEIAAKYPDGIPQFLIDLELFVNGTGSPTPPILGHAFNDLNVYFCVPENTKLMAYWDVVDDRLFKIEHSMNIKGVLRTLALFEPPLNPLDLVRAAAAGVNVQGALAQGTPLIPAYRFESAVAFAQRMTDSVIGFGSELLSALEKNDAERLNVLQTGQATQILQMTVTMKEQRVTEVTDSIAALQASLESAQYRQLHYTTLMAENLSPDEQIALDAMAAALAFNLLASILNTAAAIGYAIPQVGSPFAMTYGGVQIGSMVQASAGVAQVGAEISNFIANRSSTMAGYSRRYQDWELQQQVAGFDVRQIQATLDAAREQLAQANQDLAITKLQLSQNEAIASYLSTKFTNQQLYAWMVAQLSAIYFQAFQTAAAAAKRAEGAYQFETDTSTSFIAFDYWNSLYKGLLAGESLKGALNRMESSYREQNTRRLEITKVISLGMIAPEALLLLKATGKCDFELKEELFDYDYPGQYARKIAAVTVSVPALLGPYQTIKAILTQTSNQIVTEPNIDAVDYLLGITTTPPASGLRTDWMKNQSIALSQAVDDSGMFVLSFGDERYLPFENTGAVSKWTLDMPLTTNRFNFAQLADVIITVRYTALADAALGIQVKQSLASAPYDGGVYIDVMRSQPSAWFAFSTDHTSTTTQKLTIDVPIAQAAYYKSYTITTVWVQLDLAKGVTIADGSTFLSLTAGSEPVQTPPITGGIARLTGLTWPGTTTDAPWVLSFDLTAANIAPLLTGGFIDPAKLVDVEVIAVYEAVVF
jgi:hypothetical protein